MTNSQNGVKHHENSVKNANHAESVGNILDNVENVPFALRGSTVKTIIYFLFSFLAAAEMTAALTFYTASIGFSLVLAAVFCGLVAFGFHALLHSILSDTAKGIVFSKRKESGAMSNEVNVNIVLSIFLLAIASCTVFFIGKKGFTAYRATAYEKKADDEKGKLPPIKSIDASMLTNKSGKIAAWKLEALTDLEKAKAKGIEATTAQTTAERQSYDATTTQITDIVGASAFLIELLLALLAYSIATAKLAAVMDEIARRNGASQPSQQAATNSTTAQGSPSVTPTNMLQAASQQASPTATNKTGITKNFLDYSENDQMIIIEALKEELEEQMYYFSIDQCKGYLSRLNMLITTITENNVVKMKFHEPINANDITVSITQSDIEPTQKKRIGFSDNKAETGNEGRAIVKGFQRSTPSVEKKEFNPTAISKQFLRPEPCDELTAVHEAGHAIAYWQLCQENNIEPIHYKINATKGEGVFCYFSMPDSPLKGTLKAQVNMSGCAAECFVYAMNKREQYFNECFDRFKTSSDFTDAMSNVGDNKSFVEYAFMRAYQIILDKSAAFNELTKLLIDAPKMDLIDLDNFVKKHFNFKSYAMRSESPYALRREQNDTSPAVILNCAYEVCGKPFERRTTFQKYCCENCRIAAFTARTGKPFTKKKAK